MSHIIYFCASAIMATGLFIMVNSDNYVRKLIGLGIFQNSVLIFYIAFGKIKNGIPPIERYLNTATSTNEIYANPLPHILMLTAIVVGFATFAVGLALIYRIKKQYNSTFEMQVSLCQ